MKFQNVNSETNLLLKKKFLRLENVLPSTILFAWQVENEMDFTQSDGISKLNK